jgi:AraC-like DNA-binding protein
MEKKVVNGPSKIFRTSHIPVILLTAKEPLQTTSMNITEVGYEVEMKSVSVFSKLFKEEFGYSPTDFLHQNLKTNLVK